MRVPIMDARDFRAGRCSQHPSRSVNLSQSGHHPGMGFLIPSRIDATGIGGFHPLRERALRWSGNCPGRLGEFWGRHCTGGSVHQEPGAPLPSAVESAESVRCIGVILPCHLWPGKSHSDGEPDLLITGHSESRVILACGCKFIVYF